MNTKLLIKSLLQKFGYQLRKTPKVKKEYALLHLDSLHDLGFLCQNPEIIFDIGAHVGQTAREYRAAFPNASIYSFEPFPESFNKVKEMERVDSRLHVFNLGISDKEGDSTLYFTQTTAMNSVFRFKETGKSFLNEASAGDQKSCSVTMTTLNAFCSAKNISKIDICKVDVQGAELTVLNGASNLLLNKQIGVLILEVNFNPYYEGQSTFAQIYSLLYSHGFTLFGLYGMNHGKNNLALTECDAIFIGEQTREKLGL